MINPYQYPDLSPQVSLMTKEQTLLWNHSRVEFASAFTTRYLGDTKIMGDYFFPHGLTKTPLTILIHGMGDRSVIPCRMIAKDLAKQGIASFILYLVFHTLRAPPSIKTRYPNLSTQEWDESYKISVTDVHQVLDWVGSRPEINQSQISVLGISYGSFITSIAMALDKRLNKGVFGGMWRQFRKNNQTQLTVTLAL
jgi:cephalosporin-C deacetylase-like acetyl esterase